MDALDWPEPWVSVGDERQASALVAELARELSAGHVLCGARFRPLARSDAAADVLFEVEVRGFGVAEVHLTRSRETDPRWPRTTVFLDREAWRASRPEWP